MKSFYRTLLVAVLALVGAGVQAQSLTTAAVNGSVASTTGEPLAGATVRIVHVPSGTASGAVANAQGRFNIQGLRTGGPYTVTVDYVGYQKYEAGNIFLSLGTDKSLPIVMKEEGVALGTVEIATRRDLVINSGRTGANTVIDATQIQNMPTLNRDLNSMLRFTPQSNGSNGFGGRSSSLNNYTLDGALLNSNFGLSGTLPGEGANANPVTFEALDQVSASIAPYDVRQFGFTGAGVALATRAGTNEFEGSVAWFLQRGNWSRAQVAGTPITLAFSESDRYAGRFGGPIIKDKLFFHIAFERTISERPGFSRRPFEAGETADATLISNVSADSLRLVANAVRSAYGYDVGGFGVIPTFTKATNISVRLDYNINDNHKLSLRWTLLDAFDDRAPSGSNNLGIPAITRSPLLAGTLSSSRAGGPASIPFRSAFYTFTENVNTVSLELNSTLFGGKASNQLIVTGSLQWSPQLSTSDEAFPYIEIFNTVVPGQNATSFGSELFRQANSIQQNQYFIQNNFSYTLGKHNITIGGQFERYFFNNRFQRSRWGLWRFRSFDAFIRNIQTPAGSPIASSAAPSQVVVSYDFDGRNSDAFVDAYRIGFYVQDKWTPYEGFNLTAGVRVDVPGHLTTPNRNNEAVRFGIETDVLPETYVAFSPRVGINWDVFKDGKLQIRGGTGVFTGTLPFVWMTNNVVNTGLNQGGVIVTSGDGPANLPGGIGGTGAPLGTTVVDGALPSQINLDAYRRFSPTVPPTQLYSSNRTPNAPAPGSLELNYADPTFRYPSVWRSSFGADFAISEDWVASIDYAYTQDLDAFFFSNEILRTQRIAGRMGPTNGGAPEISRYGTTLTGSTPLDTAKSNRGFGNIIKFNSVNDGWAGFLTLQLQKRMSNGWSASAAYTYTAAQAVTDGSGSQALSTWQANSISPVVTPNASSLAPSGAVTPHRFILQGSYEWKQSKYTRTIFSAFYQIQSGGRLSYRYNGDLNNDGVTNNDLIFVPQTQNDIFLVPTAGINTGTAAQQWAQLNAFISQDPYLASRRGQWTERNGGGIPSVGRVDVGIRQDFMWEVLGKQNTLQISVDIINFGNLLNEDWGVVRTTNVNTTTPLEFNGFNGPGGIATFTVRQIAQANNVPLNQSFILNPNAFTSRFSIQFGVRYIWGR